MQKRRIKELESSLVLNDFIVHSNEINSVTMLRKKNLARFHINLQLISWLVVLKTLICMHGRGAACFQFFFSIFTTTNAPHYDIEIP